MANCIAVEPAKIKEMLMRAYVAGWNDGHAGVMNDDAKREVAQDLLDSLQKGD
jgi:hypothetical protein